MKESSPGRNPAKKNYHTNKRHANELGQLSRNTRWPPLMRWFAAHCAYFSKIGEGYKGREDLPAKGFPVENEAADICPEKDANDDVSVVVHGEPG